MTVIIFAAGPQDEPFFLQDSSGALAIALRDGAAAARMDARRGDEVTLYGLDGASPSASDVGERGG